MIESVTVAMPSRSQRIFAFLGFLGYVLTQAQVEAHRQQRAQLLKAAAPTPAVTPLQDWGMIGHHRTGDLHEGTPHIHRSVAGADVWPHEHDG